MGVKSLVEKLKKEGHRMTVTRKTVIGVFAASGAPLSVADIAARLKAKKVLPNKTTLYRELAFMLKSGIINEIDFGDGKKHYESASMGHHHHLVCVKCGKIEHVTIDGDLKLEEQRILIKKRFKTLRHALEFFGLCSGCYY